jgi:putrescine---pyruvate transaminase
MTEREMDELIRWDADHILHAVFPVGQTSGLVVDSGKGIYIRDIRGREYIDGSSQLTCVNLGHSQQEIIDAAYRQMRKLQFSTTFLGVSNLPMIECSKRLAEQTPEGLDYFHFTSGGSESTEVAYRFARLFWNRKGSQKYKIVSLYDSYHGITLGSSTANGLGRGFFTRGAGPPIPGFIHIPNYHCYHCMMGLEYPSCGVACAHFLEEAIIREGADTVAAFIAEPEHGTAGSISPPPEYWPIVSKICAKYDVLLIADEVMTGFGRTGKMFGVEHWNIIPDILTMAKGITSAYFQLGAVAINQKVHEGLRDSVFGSYTYSGHPVALAAAVKTIEIYVRDRIVENAAIVGKYAKNHVEAELKPLPCVGDIGGLGLMLGIEIVSNKETRRPFPLEMNVLAKIFKQALEAGLFMRGASSSIAPGDRLCFTPPLIITTEQVDRMIDILYPILSGLKPL